MQVHHLNCGVMRPYGGAYIDGQTPGMGPATLACHCLLVETEAGPVLIDTGTVSTDPRYDKAHLDPTFQRTTRVRLDASEAAFNQMRALGIAPSDVRHVIMTHLDFDHAGGLRDFPGATVHLSAAEAYAARHPTGALGRMRYCPAQWGDIGRWQRHEAFDTDWFGIPAAEVLPGISLVWLPGHTDGHCGVAIQTENGWLLHAGDAVMHHRELAATPGTPTGARLFQWTMQTSQWKRRRSLRDLRRVVREHGDEVRVICTHDPSQI